MDIKKYEVFLRAVELGSLTSAGEELGYTQSGVSHMMKSLETETGFQLLTRGRTGVSATPNGEQLIPAIRELINWNNHLDQTIMEMQGIQAGTLNVGTYTSIAVKWLPQIISTFQSDYPGIHINLIEGGIDEIEEWIYERRVDFAFLSTKPGYSYDYIPLRNDDFVAVLPINHPMSAADAVPISYFAGKPFIMTTMGFDYDIHRHLENNQFPPIIKFRSGDDRVILSMVASGLGISMLPELVLPNSLDGVVTKPVVPKISRQLGIGVPSLKDISPAARKFISYAKNLLLEMPLPSK